MRFQHLHVPLDQDYTRATMGWAQLRRGRKNGFPQHPPHKPHLLYRDSMADL